MLDNSDGGAFRLNRTFMELKQRVINKARKPCPGLNRTFMELKLLFGFELILSPQVLIEPLWN